MSPRRPSRSRDWTKVNCCLVEVLKFCNLHSIEKKAGFFFFYPDGVWCERVRVRQEYFSQFQNTTNALPCHIYLPVCLWIMDPDSRAPKKSTSHGNEVLPQVTRYLIQRPCYQRGSPCQGPVGNRTTRRPPDHRKETHGHVSRSSGLAKTILQGTVGRQHQEMDRLGVRKVPEGSGEQGKMEETSCKIIGGAPTTLAVKE